VDQTENLRKMMIGYKDPTGSNRELLTKLKQARCLKSLSEAQQLINDLVLPILKKQKIDVDAIIKKREQEKALNTFRDLDKHLYFMHAVPNIQHRVTGMLLNNISLVEVLQYIREKTKAGQHAAKKGAKQQFINLRCRCTKEYLEAWGKLLRYIVRLQFFPEKVIRRMSYEELKVFIAKSNPEYTQDLMYYQHALDDQNKESIILMRTKKQKELDFKKTFNFTLIDKEDKQDGKP
jgi:hypothetical protein